MAAGLLLLTACDRPGVSSGQVSLASSAGSVVVECIDENFARIVSWQPAPGYVAKVVVQGPSSEASLNFESPVATDLRVAIRCRDGQATLEEFEDEDHPIPPEGS